MLTLLFAVVPFIIHVDTDNKEVIIYEAHTECELRDFGTIMECTSYEQRSGKVVYTVCTIDEHGTVCIDHE